MDYHPFPQTHWSLIRRAGADGDGRREALATLLSRYEPALRSYLRAVRKLPPDQADDLLQAFIAEQLLEYNLIARADQTRGRFRTLLLTSLQHFAASRYRHDQRRATGALPPDAAASAGPSPQKAVEAAWVRSLVHDVIAAMELECRQTNRPDIWLVFEGRILSELFGKGPLLSYQSLAETLRLSSPTQAANLLVTAKRMYARLLRQAVGEYEKNPEDIEAEIADLRHVLAADASDHFRSSGELAVPRDITQEKTA